jgi:sarcosine oxidase, subunit beta
MGSKTPGGARRGETVGSGTIRAQFPTETEVRFSLEAIGAFERFPEEFGVDIGYRKIGYLFLVGEAEDLLGYRQRMAMQRRLGVDVREITPAEAKAIVPALRVDDLVAAVWGPQDGRRTGRHRFSPPACGAGSFAAEFSIY